jgi:hypothetical protein
LFNSIGADDSLALVAAWQRTERCAQALAAPEFAAHVETEGRTVEEVVEQIVSYL